MWPKPDHSELLRPSFRTSVGTIEKEKFSVAWDSCEDGVEASNSCSHLTRRRSHLFVSGAHTEEFRTKRQRKWKPLSGPSTSCSRNQLPPLTFELLEAMNSLFCFSQVSFHSAPRWPNKIDTTFSRCQYKPQNTSSAHFLPVHWSPFIWEGVLLRLAFPLCFISPVLSLAHLQPLSHTCTLFFWLVPGACPVELGVIHSSHQHYFLPWVMQAECRASLCWLEFQGLPSSAWGPGSWAETSISDGSGVRVSPCYGYPLCHFRKCRNIAVQFFQICVYKSITPHLNPSLLYDMKRKGSPRGFVSQRNKKKVG